MCSYYLHLDTSDDLVNTQVIDFGREILGVASTRPLLTATADFQVPGVNYVLNNEVALGANDQLGVDGSVADLETVTALNGREHVRFFIDCS